MSNLPATQVAGGELAPVDPFFQQEAARMGGTKSLSEGIGGGYGIIGYRGKTWSLRYKGEAYHFVRPDDKTPAGYIDVIILRSADIRSKSFYENFDPNAFEGKPPTCSSLDGIMPDEGVLAKQSETCALCKRNAWYVNDKGMKTKDCSDYKRLAVLLLPSQTEMMLGEALMEPVFLRVPAGSLQNLARFGDDMARQGRPFFSFVTRITFNPDKAHPEFVFRNIQVLTAKEGGVVIPLVQDETGKRITGEDQTARGQMRQITHKAPAAEERIETGFGKVHEQTRQQASLDSARVVNPPVAQTAAAAVGPVPEERMQLFAPSQPSKLTTVAEQGTGLLGGGTPAPAPEPPVRHHIGAATASTQSVNPAPQSEAAESDEALDAMIRKVLNPPT